VIAKLTERQLGILLGLIANSIWGGAALYWIQTKPVAPWDVLAHRGLWTLPAALLILIVAGRLRSALALLSNVKMMMAMAAAAALISVNWGTFLYAVTNGKATQASLGYFMLPLLTIVFGVLIFKEKLSRPQLIAVAMAVIAVGIQLVMLGTIPIIALALSGSFAAYGAIRKSVVADSLQGLFLESLFLAPVAATWILLNGGAGIGEHGLRVDFFLVASGLFTAMPLLTHVAASRMLPLSTLGLLSYLGPSLQLIVALTMLGETINGATLASFAVVWLGLLVIWIDNLKTLRRARRARKQLSQ